MPAVVAFVAAFAVSCTDGDSADRHATVRGADVVEHPEWEDAFAAEGLDGTFVLHRVGSDVVEVHDPERAAVAAIPASTFKILNSLIILETGVVGGVDTTVPWDGVEREQPAWNRDHSLRSGIEVSAVWMYQVLARRVGEERMADLVAETGYGNADIDGGIDRFWLDGDLRTTPYDQVDFLTRLATGDVPFRPEVVDAVREIIVRESGPSWAWSHKTGTSLRSTPDQGWLVGLTEHSGDTWAFALNVDLDTVDDLGQIDPAPRIRIARTVLEGAGALPAGTSG